MLFFLFINKKPERMSVSVVFVIQNFRLISVQVCDFGLSRLKARTFLSSKSAAGTVSSSLCSNILPQYYHALQAVYAISNI